MEKTSRSLNQAVKELEVGLLNLSSPTYSNIDKLMRSIMSSYGLTAKELHYGFRDSHNDKTPDEWIKSKKKMKTFREFLEEASSYRKHPHFSSREDLINHYGGKIPSNFFIKNRGSKEKPQYGLASRESRERTTQRREENIKMTTGQLTPREKAKVQRKRDIARKRGAEVHHATEIETSAKEMKNMSPGERLRHKSKQAKQSKYSGDDPRNLVIANKGSAAEFKPEQPGFHHSKYHAFERKHRGKLKDIENAITPIRAFTTLVNKERRKSRKSKELQSRMAAAAKRHGIDEHLQEFWWNSPPPPKPEPPKQEVLAYKNYKPGVLNKKTGKFTQRAHSPEEQKRYGWKPAKASVYAPGDKFTPNKVTATGDPHNWTTRNAAVPFKYKEGEAPKGQSGTPSIPYGSRLKLTAKPMGKDTKSTSAKINDVGDFGKTGAVNKDVSFDVSPQITKDIAGPKVTPKQWGKRMVYTKVTPPPKK